MDIGLDVMASSADARFPLVKPTKLVLRAACHLAECVEIFVGVHARGDTTCSSHCQHHRVVHTIQCSLLARMQKQRITSWLQSADL